MEARVVTRFAARCEATKEGILEHFIDADVTQYRTFCPRAEQREARKTAALD